MSGGVAILIALGCMAALALLRYGWRYLLMGIKYLFIGAGVLVGIGLFGWMCWIWFRECLTPLLGMAGAAHGWVGWLWAVPLAIVCLIIGVWMMQALPRLIEGFIGFLFSREEKRGVKDILEDIEETLRESRRD